MTYDPTKPDANESLKVSQSPIKDNYADAQTAFSVNHGAFAGPSSGLHIVATFVEQIGHQTSAKGERVLYVTPYSTPVTPLDELWISRVNTTTYTPITSKGFSSNVAWTFLPTGELLKYGQKTWTGPGSSNIPLNEVNQPTFSEIYWAQTTSNNSKNLISIINISTTGLSLSGNSTGSLTASWCVLGKGVS